MAVSQISQYANTIPAGTPVAAPIRFPMALPSIMDVEWIEWRVPRGPNGTVGFWLGSKGQQIIPYASGAASWIVANDESEHWDLEDQMDSGDWEMQGYNTGAWPHTVYIRFGLSVPAASSAPVLTLLSNTALSSTA